MLTLSLMCEKVGRLRGEAGWRIDLLGLSWGRQAGFGGGRRLQGPQPNGRCGRDAKGTAIN